MGGIMYCYGKFYGKTERCAECELRNYCKDGRDSALLSAHPPSVQEYIMLGENEIKTEDNFFDESDPNEKKLYSRNDILNVIGLLMSLDFNVFEYLGWKLTDPELKYADMAKKRKISRQGVHKYIKQACERVPELSVILQNRGRHGGMYRKKQREEKVKCTP